MEPENFGQRERYQMWAEALILGNGRNMEEKSGKWDSMTHLKTSKGCMTTGEWDGDLFFLTV